MELPLDSSALTFQMVGSPQPVKDFKTGQPKGDSDGLPLFRVRVLAATEAEGEIIAVKVAGQPVGLVPNAAVKVTGLTVQYWSVEGKSGIAFKAARIEAATPVRNGSQAG